MKPENSSQHSIGAGNVPQSSRVRWALAGLALSMLLPSLDTSIANVSLPTLAQGFNASFQQVQWVVLAYLLVITSLLVSVGRLGDIIGRRRLLLMGILLFGMSSLLCGIAPSLTLLIVARGIQGLGASIMMSMTLAVVGETVDTARAGRAMGLLGMMSALGTALGPSLGGLLIGVLEWRWIFLINVPLSLLAFLLVKQALPAPARAPGGSRVGFDPLGTLLLAVTLALYAFAVTDERSDVGSHSAALLVVAAVGALLFVIAESRVRSPLIPLGMFRNPMLTGSLGMSILVSTAVMPTLVVGPFYLTGALELSPAWVGLILSLGPLSAALAGLPAGRLVDRFGGSRVVLSGLLLMGMGSMLLSMMQRSYGVVGYGIAVILVTSGYSLFQTANNTTVMTHIDPAQRGVSSGLLGLAQNLGRITGAAAMGALFAQSIQADDISRANAEAIATGFRATFSVAFMLILSALVLAVGSSVFVRRAAPSAQSQHGSC